MALSEETENTESEGDVFQNVPQSTANQKVFSLINFIANEFPLASL